MVSGLGRTDSPHRGSRKHVLDWVELRDFPAQLEQLVAPVPVSIPPDAAWMPRGCDDPIEARLETFGPTHLPNAIDWNELERWWLVHRQGATTPNWDLAATALVEGQPGLILVEAKANVPELKEEGKMLDSNASARSRENHERIGAAIEEARSALATQVPGIAISRDSHYQLSNRIAFAWKLASLGLTTVLVYLGFIGDEGIRDVGEPFRDEVHWRGVLTQHARVVVPVEMLERKIETRQAGFWVVVRGRGVVEVSASQDGVVG